MRKTLFRKLIGTITKGQHHAGYHTSGVHCPFWSRVGHESGQVEVLPSRLLLRLSPLAQFQGFQRFTGTDSETQLHLPTEAPPPAGKAIM
jgi:hypothetical protein